MRRGFTLIELIFVIIIIGILAGVGIPRYNGLKQNAEVTNVFKVCQDALSSIPPAYLNILDLNDSRSSATTLFRIRGNRYWTENSGDWKYENNTSNDLNASIAINNAVTPPTLNVYIAAAAGGTKAQKLNRLSGDTDNEYNVTIELE